MISASLAPFSSSVIVFADPLNPDAFGGAFKSSRMVSSARLEPV
jgi:hypothetical protein